MNLTRERGQTPVLLTCVSCAAGGRPPPERRRRYVHGLYDRAERTAGQGLEPPENSLAKIGFYEKICLHFQSEIMQLGGINDLASRSQFG